ncbi:MAG: PASTA domain-containing protein [Weeksellaceae bacterium]|nr:PASTA domain-containing protein [Weeksellaceae bacterium]MDX9705720.1 PASTA domain-containing protein [Weeksellaceae bacterium]
MNFLKAFIKWQFWASLIAMGLVCLGLYHFIIRVWMENYTNHGQQIEIPDLTEMDIDEAIKILDDLKLTYEIDSIKFDSARLPHTVINFYPEKGFKVKEGRKIFIKSNPKDWRPTSLPDIVGKSKRLAFAQLKIAGLEVGDTIYEADLAKDAVLRVLYKGRQIFKDSELPRFSKVDLVLGKGLVYGVKMENLIGMSLEEARSSIYDNQFNVGRLVVDEVVSDSSLLKVYYQYPLPGDNYDQGLPVDLWMTTKSPRELDTKIKELNHQYRNFESNDSLSISIFEEEMRGREKDGISPSKAKEQTQNELPKESPTE